MTNITTYITDDQKSDAENQIRNLRKEIDYNTRDYSIDFLIQKFKFRKAYCKLKIRYKWWFGAIVRVLLPFRKLIWSRNVKAVLNMHKMQS